MPDTVARFQARAQQLEREDPRAVRDLPPAPAVTTPEGRPVWFPPDAILTIDEVAAVLDVSPRTVERWPIRKAFCSSQTVRYLFRDVVAYLDSRAA